MQGLLNVGTWKHACASPRSGCASSTTTPRSREPQRRTAGDRRHFGIDRRDAEIAAEGDASGRLVLRSERVEKATRSEANDSGSARIGARHRIEEQRHVFDDCAPSVLRPSSYRRCPSRARGHPPGRRAQSDDAAEARRIAQRAAHVGAMRHPGHAGRERRRRTARRSGRRARRVPRIERAPEDLVEGVGAGAEFRRVRHRIDDAALGFEILDQDVGRLRNIVGGRSASPGVERTPATSIRSLIGMGRPGEPAALSAGLLAHQASACRVRARSKHSVGSAFTGLVDLSDPRFQRIEKLERRDRAALQEFDHAKGGERNEALHRGDYLTRRNLPSKSMWTHRRRAWHPSHEIRLPLGRLKK